MGFRVYPREAGRAGGLQVALISPSTKDGALDLGLQGCTKAGLPQSGSGLRV